MVDDIRIFDPGKSLIWYLLDLPLNPRWVDLRTGSRGFSLGDCSNDSLGGGGFLRDGGGRGSGNIAVGLLCYFLGSRGRRRRAGR